MGNMITTSMPYEHYDRMQGKTHLPDSVAARLVLKQWLSDFMVHINMAQTPFREEWYRKRFVSLTSGLEDDPIEKWRRMEAIFGLLCLKFSLAKFDIPEEWTEGLSFCQKDYTLFNVQGHQTDIVWDKNFRDPEKVYIKPGKENPWLLRKELGAEFTGLYFDKAREIIAAITKASSPEETLKQHRALRDHVDEVSWFDRHGLREAIRIALPSFASEFAASTDPAVRFCCVALAEICDYRAKSSRDVCKLLIASYWERLKDITKAAEAKRLIDLIAFEVNELLDAQDAIEQSKGK
jgi:hypothetical protein